MKAEKWVIVGMGSMLLTGRRQDIKGASLFHQQFSLDLIDVPRRL